MQALLIGFSQEQQTALERKLSVLGIAAESPTIDGALAAFEARHHELMFISWEVTALDPAKLCQQIRALDAPHCSVVLFVMPGEIPKDFDSILAAGADDCLTGSEAGSWDFRIRIAVGRAENRLRAWRVEQRLRESIERFELAVRGANDGLWDAQPRSNPWFQANAAVWYSPRYKELLGYSDEEFPNLLESWASRLHPHDRQRVFQAVRAHIADRRQPYDVEYRLRTKSGEYRWFSARGQAKWDDRADVPRMAGSLRDITEIKQFESKVQQSESMWRTLVENAPDIIVLADLDGTIKFINRDTPLAKASIGHTVFEYIDEACKETMRKALEAARNTGELQRFEVHGLTERGDERIWYANRLGVIWNNREIESLILIATDITHRRIAEQRLESEKQALRRLLDLQERERKLVAYDIHDGLVQYLTGSLMHLESFAASLPSAPDDSKADYERGLSLLHEALAEGRRLISGLRPPILSDEGVGPALEYLINENRPFLPVLQLRNLTHIGRLAPSVEDAIFRITQEGLSNIRLHSGAERARVELLQRGEWLRLVIRDWGRGFDPKAVPENHYGLQGIRQRARLLGTVAIIDSAPGKGTSIVVDFPIVSAEPNVEK